MTFRSLLDPQGDGPPDAAGPEAPAFFHDLHLDQVVAAISGRWTDHDLAPVFRTPLRDLDTIAYRQEIMHDLEDEAVARPVRTFAADCHGVRQELTRAGALSHPLERDRRFLGAVRRFVESLECFDIALGAATLQSRGLGALREYLRAYRAGPDFRRLAEDAAAVLRGLSGVEYTLLIEGNRVTVRRYDGESDYAASVEAMFARFRNGAATEYGADPPDAGRLNYVELEILERTARLYPEPFAALATFATRHADYLDPAIARYDREVGFYLGYLDFVAPLRQAGLPFCYPQVSWASKEIACRGMFDIALAAQLVPRKVPVVSNDFELRRGERIIVVSGPNHAGKTTFARTFGQLHYLAALGCPVPGASARLFLFDHLLVHFEREERMTSQRGKLQDDLIRMHEILAQATGQSIIILNEVFASTTVHDALTLSRRVLEEISERDILTVCVTFLDELAAFNARTVSLVGIVDAADPNVRTFVLERRPADGRAYARAIAEKFRVTHEQLVARLP